MEEGFWLIARDKPGLLLSMMNELAGNAHISFEGDLSHCDFIKISGTSSVENGILKRNTIEPIQDFIILPLESETIPDIIKGVFPSGGITSRIVHIQIEKNGRIEFGAYDKFHPTCILCGKAVSITLLEHLLDKGVLRSFKPMNKVDK
jgi:hypothetical protein